MSNYRSEFERAEHDVYWTLPKVVLAIFLVMVSVSVLGVASCALGLVGGAATNVAAVIQKEFYPDALLKKYEWFKDASAAHVMSAYSGQVLIYSTVRGKVTSSGKRLNPKTLHVGDAANAARYMGFKVLGEHETEEVLEDDGTYGDSVPYVYWFDAKGVYHQHYIEGGQILHVSDQPLAVKSIVLNMESTTSTP